MDKIKQGWGRKLKLETKHQSRVMPYGLWYLPKGENTNAIQCIYKPISIEFFMAMMTYFT